MGYSVRDECPIKYWPSSPQMLSATVSLCLGAFCKMLLILDKVEGSLAVCLLVGFRLSPAMDT